MNFQETAWYRHVCALTALIFSLQILIPHGYEVYRYQSVSIEQSTQSTIDSLQSKISKLLNAIGDTLISPAGAQTTGDSTPEFDLNDPYLVAKAQELGNNPSAIFAFVRDEITYEVYEGSLRGARGTLWSGAGNSVDQASLLIALLRISGVDASYLQGTLATAEAQTLIASMFEPEPYRVVGFVPDDAEISDPVNDPELIAEASQHVWVDAGPGMGDLDPSFRAAFEGDSFTAVSASYSEVPDNLRHKITVRLRTEKSGGLSSLFGFGFQETIVLKETFTAVELVGKPLSLSHFVNSSGQGGLLGTSYTHTYSPFLTIVQNDGNLENDPIIRGLDYQEFLSSVFGGLANSYLTGLFLDIETTQPNGQTELVERAILDRVGYAARQGAGTSTGLGLDEPDKPAFTPVDVHTIVVSGSNVSLQLPAAHLDELTLLLDEAQQLSENLENADITNLSVAEQADASRLQAITPLLSMSQNQALVAQYDSLSKELEQQFSATELVKSYFTQPRILLQSAVGKVADSVASQEIKMDLAHNQIRAVALPGQGKRAEFVFQITRGFSESAIEAELINRLLSGIPSGDASSPNSVINILQAAEAQGIELEYIGRGNSDILSTTDYSSEAKARISQAIEQDKLILIPKANVNINGQLTIGWFEIDLLTGEVQDVNEHGEHFSAGEYAFLITQQVGLFAVGFFVGFAVTNFIFISIILTCLDGPSTVSEFCANNPEGLNDIKAVIQYAIVAAAIYAQALARKAGYASLAFALGVPAGIAAARNYLSKATDVDPPLPDDLLVGLLDTNITISSGQTFELIAEPFFTLPVGTAQSPSLFRALIKNNSATEQTYIVSVPNAPSGFSVRTSLPSVTIPAGDIGVVGVGLIPSGTALPPAGSSVPFELQITDEQNNTQSQSATFIVPAIVNVELELEPALAASLPGDNVSATLTVRSTGNADASNIPLNVSASSGLSVSGVSSPLTLPAGQTQSFEVTLSAASTTLNQDLDVVFTALYGQDLDGNPYEATATGTLRVRSAAVLPIEEYAIAAELAGNDQLAQTLYKIAELTAQLEQDPDNAALQDRLVFAYDQLLQLAVVNPGLDTLVQQITELRDLAATGDTSQLLSSGEMLFDANAPTLGVGVALDMSLPDRLELEPGQSGQLALYLENKGDSPLTLSLALAPTPAEVTATLNQTSVTLQAGEILDQNSVNPVLIDIAQNFTSDELFTLRLQATPSDVDNVTLSTSSLIAVRSALADVIEVSVNPAVLDSSSAQASVQAQVMNSANSARQVKALLQVTQADGTPIADLSPVIVDLTTGSTPIIIDFGVVTLPPLADGVYRMKVSLLTLDNQPLLGRSADSSFLIGSPVSATVEAQPVLLPPGDAQAGVQIAVERRFGDSIGLGDFIPTDPSLDRINWAAAAQGSSISNGTFLIDGLASGINLYATAPVGTYLTLDMGVEREFDAIQLHLWDNDDRNYEYLIEHSLDGVNYTTLVDKSEGGYSGLQIEQFESVTARYLRFSGTNTVNANFHLIDELLVIGDATTTPFITSIIEIDGVANAGSNFSNGQVESLAAGVYEVRYLDGAISPWGADTFNNGRTWQVSIRADIPMLNKNYQLGFVHDAISRYPTAADAEAAAQGKFFTFYLPARSDVYFWFSDSTVSDNRGSQRIQLRQLSGPNDSLVVRVQDAMTRSVLWEQNAVASWDSWIRTSNYDCFGCHIQSQASTGLAVSKQKIPTLPIDAALTDKFIGGYQSWQDERDFVSPFHNGGFSITQTSLWAWAVSHYDGAEQEQMAIPLLRSLNWLLGRQRADGAWIADHTDSNAAKLYFDGVPSATHTAGNIEALGKAIDIIDATLANGEDIIAFDDVSVIDNSVDFGRNPGTEVWYTFDAPAGVTGIKLTVSDSFAGNSNIVLNELQLFNGDQELTINSAIASREQSGFPIAESINGIRTDQNDGWAVSGNTLGSPADGLWVLGAASSLDRLRITQIYPDHQLEQISFFYTTDANPTLASTFVPLMITQSGMAGLETKAQTYSNALIDASNALAASTWNYQRNVRTAAQTLLGLTAAMPYLDATSAAAAQLQIDQMDAYLRSIQNGDGGWGDSATAVSRTFQTAQALEALLQGAETTVDPAILAGAEYLLLTQRPNGDWVSPPLARSLASTTWVQIALPTIFENFTGLTINLEHYMPLDSTQAAYVSDSANPALSNIQAGTTLQWDDVLGRSDIAKSFALNVNVPNLQPGEIRQISEGSLLRFISVQNEGQIELDPLFVAGAHIIDLQPGSQTLTNNGSTQYDVILDNPTDTAQTYTLNVLGLEDLNVAIDPSIAVPANSSVTTPLNVTYSAGAAGDRVFTVQALTSSGGVDSVQGQLILIDDVIIPGGEPPEPIDLISLAVDVQLLPSSVDAGQGTAAPFIVRVTNTGDETEAFTLSGVFPSGFAVEWGETQVTLLPGLGNYRDVILRLTPPVGTSAGAYPISVSAAAVSDASVSDSASGQVNVLGLGVELTLNPDNTTPNSTLQLSVTNTGLSSDTYQLQLAGAAANFAELAQTGLTLAAGATQTLNVNVSDINLALPGELQLIAQATSQTDLDVNATDLALVQIAPRRGVSAVFEPDEILIEQPGSASSALLVQNTGNVEDIYEATLQPAPDPLLADFVGLSDELTQSVVGFRIPPLATALIRLDGTVLDYGRGTVSADVISQTDSLVSDSAAVLLGTQNRPPLADAGEDQNALTGTVVFLDGSNSYDPDGDLIGFGWSVEWDVIGLPAGSQLLDSDLAGRFGPNPSFIPDVDGDYTLQLTVDDGAALATDTVVISAYTANVPPNADAGTNAGALVGQSITLDGSASNDPDAGPQALSYQWTLQQAPTGSLAQLSNVTLVQASFSPDVAGVYTFALTVNDGLASDSDTVLLEANTEDLAPIANAGIDQHLAQGNTANLDGRASYDPDNAPEALSYQWQFISLPASSTLTDVAISGFDQAQASFQPDVQGSYLMQLEVSDGLYLDRDSVLISTSCVGGLSADPETLWSPNHDLRPVTISVADACGLSGSAQCTIYEVTSNQPINGKGDGNTDWDWEITGDLTVDLRAERSGVIEEDRIYTMHLWCIEPDGQRSYQQAQVNVPHNE